MRNRSLLALYSSCLLLLLYRFAPPALSIDRLELEHEHRVPSLGAPPSTAATASSFVVRAANTSPPAAAMATLPPSPPSYVPSARSANFPPGGRASPILVGLNKPVYKNERQRAYVCPSLRGRGCVFTTDRARFAEAHALIDVLKDARKAAPLDFKVKRHQLKGVIISEKDEAKQHSSTFKRNRYDFEVGYNRQTATIWRPFMCNEVSRKTNLTIAEVLLRGSPRSRSPSRQGLNAGPSDRWPHQTGELAAFVSNCAAGWRLAYLQELRKHVTLDSFGGCAHNNDTCPKSGRRKCDKVVMAGAYRFVFAFENSEESHYVTEKVYTGLRSGAVPIYKGAPEVLQHVPAALGGGSSIILADQFASAAALGMHLRKLLADSRAYDAHHAWDLEAFARSDAVAQCPWQCRVCEWVAAHAMHGR